MKKVQYYDATIFPISFGICFNEKAFTKEMNRVGVTPECKFLIPGSVATTHSFMDLPEHPLLVIACFDLELVKSLPKLDLISMSVHEAVHVWQQTLVSIGEPNPGIEIEAYAIQWFSRALMEKVLEVRKKLKNSVDI